MAETLASADWDSRAEPAATRDTFVVRIWAADDSNRLRGHVQHVRTRKRTYFVSPEHLLKFIQNNLLSGDQCRG
jgi:hypothetical protein